MMLRPPFCRRAGLAFSGTCALLFALAGGPAVAAGNYPVSPTQRATAQQVAQAGVPLSELAPNAPDSHTVQRGDTLWDISKMFLKSPWRWPELWGMNLDQIHNPHLIYPGQVLVLDKSNGMARLRLAGGGVPLDTIKLSPHVRSDANDNSPISSVPLHLLQPFLNEAVVFNGDELVNAPRVVAAPEGRVLMSRGDIAYVRGDRAGAEDFRVFRTATPLLDPTTKEVLGFEAPFLGTAQFVRAGGTTDEANPGKAQVVPDTYEITGIRQEVGVGDKLSPVPERDYTTFAPHSPTADVSGQIISIYGAALNAGQNQIVALNRGKLNGLDRGDVLALWHDGAEITDSTDPDHPKIKLPDERQGLLFVFSVFDRVSYALILSVLEPVHAGDRFTQP